MNVIQCMLNKQFSFLDQTPPTLKLMRNIGKQRAVIASHMSGTYLWGQFN